MVNPYRFYTYAYLREDGTPYYIGKGRDRRAYNKSEKEIKLPKDKTRIIFLKQNLTEEEAFKHEKYMISVFGRIDLGTGILRNKTDGGEGPSGRIPWNKNKKGCFSEETRKKMSGENNPSYGKKGKENPCYGLRWWHDDNDYSKLSLECPGEGWVLGMGQGMKTKMSVANKGKNQGKKWWNDGCGNSKRALECPGEGWVLGQDVEHKRKNSKSNTKRHS